jgi:hypothetical protein
LIKIARYSLEWMGWFQSTNWVSNANSLVAQPRAYLRELISTQAN